MKYSALNLAVALGLVALEIGIAAGGIYLGETDDAPGASLAGIPADDRRGGARRQNRVAARK
jgi:hypothetical protein